jgi:K+-transporting ATPase ATPase C chain
MKNILSKSLWLLLFTVIIGSMLYPGVLYAVGQVFFPYQANGSILKGPNGQPVGSQLIAQPFTQAEYFWPRPSAAGYNAAASASSALAASNYALRNRVAEMLGPIVTYKSGPKAGQLVAPDIEAWFQQDMYQGNPHIVAQWANLHDELAVAWVNADPTHAAFVNAWAKAHPDVVAQFVKDNPGTPQPQATDLAAVFFQNFSQENPGKFPSAVTNGTATTIQPVSTGTDIQSIFFDMWRQDHPNADLNDVPGDMVTTSGSGLDPNITLENAEYQLDRVAAQWATDLKRDPATIKPEIEQILQANASAPLGGLVGEKLINVLQVNLTLVAKYGEPPQ